MSQCQLNTSQIGQVTVVLVLISLKCELNVTFILVVKCTSVKCLQSVSQKSVNVELGVQCLSVVLISVKCQWYLTQLSRAYRSYMDQVSLRYKRTNNCISLDQLPFERYLTS